MSNSYSDDSGDSMGMYQRDILKRRRDFREALSEAQTQHDTHNQPLYHDSISAAALRAHQLALDLTSELAARQNQIPNIWRSDHVATYHHPIEQNGTIHFQPMRVEGLENVLNWRNATLPREIDHPGDTNASADITPARAYIPIEVASGTRMQLDKALAKLGWLPEGEITDFKEPEPSV